MGYFTPLGLNACLGTTGYATTATYAGLLTAAAAKTGTATASTDLINSTTHGYSNGDLVVFTTLTGGAGLTLNKPYFVINQATNTFQVAETPSGSVVNFGTDYSTINVKKLTEISGGSPAYARKALTWGSPAAANPGSSNDTSADPVFDIPAAGVVDFQGDYSASTAGNLLALDDVTQETFGSQGTYTLTSTVRSLTSP